MRVVHGDAKGADTLARIFVEDEFSHHIGLAEEAGLILVEQKRYPANWNKYNRSAGIIRNQEMLDKESINLVLAFPGGTGTADMIKRARSAEIPVRQIEA